MKKLLLSSCGWLGILFIQGANLPTLILRVTGHSNAPLPPLTLTLMVWIGLVLFMIRSIAQRDWVYTVSNGIGFAINSLMLALIFTR